MRFPCSSHAPRSDEQSLSVCKGTAMTLAPSNPVLNLTPGAFLRAKTAKAAGKHALAVTLLQDLIAQDPEFAPASRMLQVIDQYPNQAFTYTRVVDFIFSKGWGIYDCFFTTEQLVRQRGLKTGVE